MTEAEWLASDDPRAMMRVAAGRRSNCCGCRWADNGDGSLSMLPGEACCPRCDNEPFLDGFAPLASDRKLRLFACASARLRWGLLTDYRSREAVQAAERFADGGTPPNFRGLEFNRTDNIYEGAQRFQTQCCLRADAAEGAVEITGRVVSWDVRPAQAALLRDIIGSPWRPARMIDAAASREIARHTRFRVNPPPGPTLDGGILTPEIRSLAQAAHDERGLEWVVFSRDPATGVEMVRKRQDGDGTLDPARLAVLSDALEEAGCVVPPMEARFYVVADALARPGADAPEDWHVRHCSPLSGNTLWTGKSRLGAQSFAETHCCVRSWETPTELAGFVWAEGVGYTPEQTHPIVAHLRSPGPHVRGCWALDLVLGKE